jgi:tungstate transport system substrate-binding protein
VSRLAAASIALFVSCHRNERSHSILVVTTTVRDTGLADAILPVVEQVSGFHVTMVSGGSGEALQMGRRGDADVIVAHSPSDEEAFMRDGFGTRRRRLMTNEFVVVGPPSDPARVAGAKDVGSAFASIAAAHSPFVSRGDRSGTHIKELAIWQSIDQKPEGPWYLSVGVGQGDALRLAMEKGAYMLVDRSTYLVQRSTMSKPGANSSNEPLKILYEGGEILTNVYSVIEVRQPPGRQDRARRAAAIADALMGPRVQDAIAAFGVDRFGAPLFRPASR